MIFNNQSSTTKQSKLTQEYQSYESWKLQNQIKNVKQAFNVHDKENNIKGNVNLFPQYHLPSSSDFCKKQVRFKNPNLQVDKKMINLQQTSNINYHCNKPFLNCDSNSVSQPKLVTNKTLKPFEQIYMANIPNRHLDLSIIETNQTPFANKQCEQSCNKTSEMPKTVQKAVCDGNRYASPILESVFEHSDSSYKPNAMNSSNNESFEPVKISPKVPSTYREYKAYQNISANKKDTKLNYKKLHSQKSKAMIDSHKACDVMDSSVGNGNSYCGLNLNVDTDLLEPKQAMHNNRGNFTVQSSDLKDSLRNITTQYSANMEGYKYKKDGIVQTDDSDVISTHENCSNPDYQPTVKDLLKIIQQQNEQLLILQKQVAKLIENQNMPMQIEGQQRMKQIEPTPDGTTNVFGKEVINSTGHNILKPHDMKKGPLSKFAIDVMTSFEVSIRPPPNFNQRNKYHKEFLNHEPKIQEITGSDSENTKNSSENMHSLEMKNSQIDSEICQKNDESLVFSGSVPVHEDCISPENSIHIDMQDYSSE